MTFTDRHEAQLSDFFSGAYVARMGARSWMGPMLDHAKMMGVHPPDRSREYMPVAPEGRESKRGADITEDGMAAAREQRHVRSVLLELPSAVVNVLRLAYAPRPRGAESALVLALVGGLAHAGDDPEQRKAARRAIAGARKRAEELLEHARAAYAIEEDRRAVRPGARAARAFAASMASRGGR